MKTRRDPLTVAKVINACKNGASIVEITAHFKLSESTVTRILRDQRAHGETIDVKKGRPRISRPTFRFSEKRSSQPVDDEQIEAVCRQLTESVFPFPSPLPPERADREFARLRALEMRLENGVIRPWSFVGIPLCAPFFPNRFRARSKNALSAVDAWRSESEIRKAVRFQLSHGDPVTPQRVRRAITLRCRTPMIFRPAVARFIYERYCRPGDTTWDPCAGFGGRLLGAAAAGVHYIGTDVDAETIKGNRDLATTIRSTSVLHHTRAEIFDPPAVKLVFTSPPYFNQEKYSDSEEQSWKKHGLNLKIWIEGFLQAVITRAHKALTEDGYLVLNIANVKGAPLVREATETAMRCGFIHVETLQMPLSAINRVAPQEPVLVFRKNKDCGPCDPQSR